MNSWQTRRLGDIAEIAKGKGLSKDDIITGGRNECIHYGELFTKYSELIKEVKSRTNITDGVYLSQAGDVLMPTSDVTPRGLATASFLPFSGVIIGGDVLVIRPRLNELDGRFLAYFIAGNKHAVLRLTTGSTIFHLYGSDMKKMNVNLPSTEEQERIVAVLNVWDEYIEKLEQKITLKEELKKGLMQQLMIGNLRITGFTRSWIKKKVEEIAHITKGAQRNKNTLMSKPSPGHPYPVINGGILPSGYTNESNAPSECVTISEGGNSCGYVSYIRNDFWCGGHCYKITPTDIVDNYYLFILLKSYQKRIMSLRVGSGLPNIQKSSLGGLKITMPEDITEQKRVGLIMMCVINDIETLKLKRNKLKLQKKYLLYNLVNGNIRTPENLILKGESS